MSVPSFVLRLSSSPYTIYPLLRLVNQNTSSCQLAHAEILDWNSALGYSENNHKPTRGHTYFPVTYHSIQQLLEYMYISPMSLYPFQLLVYLFASRELIPCFSKKILYNVLIFGFGCGIGEFNSLSCSPLRVRHVGDGGGRVKGGYVCN